MVQAIKGNRALLLKVSGVSRVLLISRVACALAVSILELNQITLAGCWWSGAGAFDGSGSVHRPLRFRLAGGQRGGGATATKSRRWKPVLHFLLAGFNFAVHNLSMQKKDIPNWEKLSWEDKRIYLRGLFTSGDIKRATRNDLEDFLIVLANAQNGGSDKYGKEAETERQAVVVRHLIQIRLGEELHERSHRIAIAALIVSVLTAAFACWQALAAHQGNANKTQSPIVAPTNTPVLSP
jgi:hypothetical protein